MVFTLGAAATWLLGGGLFISLVLLPACLGSVQLHSFAFSLLPVAIGLTFWFWMPRPPAEVFRLRSCRLRPWILGALLAYVTASFFSKVPFRLPEESLKILGGWLVFEATLHFGQSRNRRYRMAQFALFAGAGFSLFGLLQYLGAVPKFWWSQPQFLSGPYVNHNHFAGLLEMILPISLGLAIAERELPKKSLYLFATVLTMLAFLLALSRGAYLALAFGLILMFVRLLIRRVSVPALPMLLGIALLLVGALMVFGSQTLTERVRSFQGMERLDELSIRYRWVTWHGAWKVFLAHPLVGGGPGAFEFLSLQARPDSFPGRPIYAHNDWLQLLADQGLLGFTAVAALFTAFFFQIKRILSRDDSRFRLAVCTGAAGSVAALCLHGFFDFNFQIPANWIWLCFAAGLLQCFDERHPIQNPIPAVPLKALRALAAVAWFAALGALVYLAAAGWAYSEAQAAFSENPKTAGRSVAEAVRLYPSNPEAHYLQARFLSPTDPKRAQAAVERAIQINRFEPVYDRFRARFLALQAQNPLQGESLAAAFKTALSKDPKNARFHLLVARDLQQIGTRQSRSYAKEIWPILAKAVDLEPELAEKAADVLGGFGIAVRHIEEFFMERPKEALPGYLSFLSRRQLWRYYQKPLLKWQNVTPSDKPAPKPQGGAYAVWTLDTFEEIESQGEYHIGAFWHSTADIGRTVRGEAGCRRFSIRAKGTPAEGAYPLLIVRYGWRVVDVFYVDSETFKNYHVWIPMTSEARRLSIEYINDWKNPLRKEDRNLWVQKLELHRPLEEGSC